MWKCERHIPTSKMYPALTLKCPACGFPRPDEAYRPPINPEEPKPVVWLVPPPAPPAQMAAQPPSKKKRARVDTVPPPPPPEVDEAPPVTGGDGPEPDKVLQKEPEAPVAAKRPKDIPVTEKSKAHLCPGPKCRKVSRRNSPYCSKICSDKCLRLRKKATEKVLDSQEVKWLNRILAVLEAWDSDKV